MTNQPTPEPLEFKTVSGFPEYEITREGRIREKKTGFDVPRVSSMKVETVMLEKTGGILIDTYMRSVAGLVKRTYEPEEL